MRTIAFPTSRIDLPKLIDVLIVAGLTALLLFHVAAPLQA